MNANLTPRVANYVVVRTSVEPRKDARDYRQELRWDFWFSCAYCTISEAEASGIGFEIDHYEPESSRPDLARLYANLMYACAQCNSRKWKVCPPADARANGIRFFKADEDNAPDHFELADGDRIEGRTTVGKVTVVLLDLNRSTLLRLRELRRRIADGMEHITFGVRALKGVPIDRMSGAQRMKFTFAKVEVESDAQRIESELRELCRSELLDEDTGRMERSEQRRAHLEAWRVQYPDPWWSERKRR